jgi:polyhydroxyalkanoate synthesis regulator phasin
MDVSQLTASSSLSSAVQGVGGGGHHHHHHKSVSDQVNQMGTAIDNAVKAGTMTSDQATSLKNELADITKTLSQTAQASSTSATTATSTTGQTSQTNPLSQLSDADRKKVFGELQDVRKQLKAANSQSAESTGAANGSNAVSQLFSQIDSDGSGSIDQAEFTQFLAKIGANTLGYDQNGSVNSAYSASTFSAIA